MEMVFINEILNLSMLAIYETEYEIWANLAAKIIFLVSFINFYVQLSVRFPMHFIASKSDLLIQSYSLLKKQKCVQLIVLVKLMSLKQV